MNASDSIFGLLVGVAFLVAGFGCMLSRTSGSTTMQIQLWGLKCRVQTSLPGIIFAVLGLLVIALTRPT